MLRTNAEDVSTLRKMDKEIGLQSAFRVIVWSFLALNNEIFQLIYLSQQHDMYAYNIMTGCQDSKLSIQKPFKYPSAKIIYK